MKIIREIEIEGKNWNDIFNLPCVEGISKENIGVGEVKLRPYVALFAEYTEKGSWDIAFPGDFLVELENHKWIVKDNHPKE